MSWYHHHLLCGRPETLLANNQGLTNEPRRHGIEMHASAIIAFDLVMTLTFDLWPFSNFHSHDEYFGQVSIKSLHWVNGYCGTRGGWTTDNGRTAARATGNWKYNASAAYCWQRHININSLTSNVSLNVYRIRYKNLLARTTAKDCSILKYV